MIYDFLPIERVAMLSVHTSPLAPLGQKKTGGMNVYVRDFSRELARRGVQVDVFTRAVDNNGPTVQYDVECGCRVIQIPAGPCQTIPNDAIVNHLDEFTNGVLNFARSEGLTYNVIHSHYWLSGMVAGKLREVWGPTPIVHMYHTLGHMKNQSAQTDSEHVASVRLMGEAHTARIADILVAATEAEKSQLIEFYGADANKIVIIPPGVDLERFELIPRVVARRRLELPFGRRLILFVGRIEPLKGVDTLLRATSLLKTQHPEDMENVEVAIIGGNPNAPDEALAALQRMQIELGLQDTVKFLGAKDQSLLPTYYAAADMVVMPSHYESFGMVALEAMAMGTPVIASRVGGLAHLVEDGETGFLIPSRCPGALAGRISQILTDRALRRCLSLNARELAQQYNWPNIVDQMAEAYSVLSEPAWGS